MTELADIVEVIKAIQREIDISDDELENERKIKNQKAGAFENGDYINLVETEDSEWIEYYRRNNHKYIEIE
ncbi:hypothetical protein IPJ91_02315 [bacterium]|nr:MAG: hypothetical protein IPJ91_02315 [bacterium]